MVNLYGKKFEKVTFNMPVELKERVVALKNELNVSLSDIYNEAIANYIKQKELKKWESGVDLALSDSAYLKEAKEFSSDSGDLYEY